MSAILAQLHDDVITKAGISDLDKSLICEKLAQVIQLWKWYLFISVDNALAFYFVSYQADQCLIDGACESLQLCDVAAFITRRLNGQKADAENSGMTH